MMGAGPPQGLEPWPSEAGASPHPSPQHLSVEEGGGSGAGHLMQSGGTFLPQGLKCRGEEGSQGSLWPWRDGKGSHPVLGTGSTAEDGLQSSPHPALPSERRFPIPAFLPASTRQPTFPPSSFSSPFPCPQPLSFLPLLSLHFFQTVSTRDQGRPRFPFNLL